MKPKRILAILHPRWRDSAPCEACGEPFVCGAWAGGCWCTEIELDRETRARLRARYERCLCRACLERAAEGQIAPGA